MSGWIGARYPTATTPHPIVLSPAQMVGEPYSGHGVSPQMAPSRRLTMMVDWHRPKIQWPERYPRLPGPTRVRPGVSQHSVHFAGGRPVLDRGGDDVYFLFRGSIADVVDTDRAPSLRETPAFTIELELIVCVTYLFDGVYRLDTRRVAPPSPVVPDDDHLWRGEINRNLRDRVFRHQRPHRVHPHEWELERPLCGVTKHGCGSELLVHERSD